MRTTIRLDDELLCKVKLLAAKSGKTIWTIQSAFLPLWKSPMVLTDVNVLVYAHREDTINHTAYRAWLEDVLNGVQACGMADIVLSGFRAW